MESGVAMERERADRFGEFEMALRALRLLRGEGRDLAVVFIYALGVGLCSLAIPVGIQAVVNTVAFGVVLQPLVVVTCIVGGVLLFSGCLRIMQMVAVEMLQRRIAVRLSLSLAGRVAHVSFKEFQRKFGPEYVLRFLEVFSAQKTIASMLLDGLAVLFQIVVGLVLVSFYHPFFLIFSFLLASSLVLVVLPLGRGAVRAAIKESDAKYGVATWLQDIARVPMLFKSDRGDTFALERTDQLMGYYLKWRVAHFRVLLRQVVGSVVIQVVASTVLLGLGGWLVIQQQLTLGQLVAAEIVVGMVLTAVAKLGKYLDSFYELCASVAKLDALFDVPCEKLSGSFFSPEAAPARLEVTNLTVQRHMGGGAILDSVSLCIAPGEKVAIIGDDGSGKSTLANCIYRTVQPHAGRVEIDGHHVREVHPLELRSEVALVRDVDIFHGTIEENLTLANDSISSTRIREALEMVGLLEDIYALPEALQTILKGQAAPLSRGQAARLVLARALLQEPRLLVIDGLLDGIDEKIVSPLLMKLLHDSANWSVLVLTHEVHIVRFFDRSFVLDQGKLSSTTFGEARV
jgi:ABC-type bacteriocin/lantibiotic exporter with double-glycine peptidase domain